MTEIKYCQDCRFCSLGEHCYHESAKTRDKINLFNGKIEKGSYRWCVANRVSVCGIEAKYFQPRLTFWQKVKQWVRL